jgi:ribosomal protein S18 acetylase RimI-like enzyme
MSGAVRLAASHVKPYRDLMLRAYADRPDAFTATPEERAQSPDSWWLKRIADPEGLGIAFGHFSDEAMVGTVALEFSSRPKTMHKVLLIGMYVVPEARGRGIGKTLLDTAIEYCRSLETVTSITLTVTEGNAAAVALYRNAGFREFGVEPMAIRTADGYASRVHMQRNMAP